MWPLGENFETHYTMLVVHTIRDQYTPFATRNIYNATVKANYIKRNIFFVIYLQICFH